MLLFWRKGFAATSMNDLCDVMGVRSPSLYAAFGSKGEQLYLEAAPSATSRPRRLLVWERARRRERPRAPASRHLLIAGTDDLPHAAAAPAGCMAVLGGGGRRMARLDRARRQKSPAGKCWAGCVRGLKPPSREANFPASTDIERLEPVLPQRLRGHGDPGPGWRARAEFRAAPRRRSAAWPREG